MAVVAFPFAWTAAVIALALHVVDEAAHDFLSWYNPIARRIRSRLGGFPFPPTFTLVTWLIGLAGAVLALAALAPAAFAHPGWMRLPGYALAVVHMGNGTLHIVASLLAKRRLPGLLSAPLLIGTGGWLWYAAAHLT